MRNSNASAKSLERELLVTAEERETIPIPGTFLISKKQTNELFELGAGNVLR